MHIAAANNGALSLKALSRFEEARSLLRKKMPVAQRVRGESDALTLSMRSNYARALCYDPTATLGDLSEAVTTLEEIEQIARRVLGESHDLTLRMRWIYAGALYLDPGATLDDLRETVTTLEEIERIARRVLGGAHPLTSAFERHLRRARDTLAASEGDDVSSVCDMVAAMTPGDA